MAGFPPSNVALRQHEGQKATICVFCLTRGDNHTDALVYSNFLSLFNIRGNNLPELAGRKSACQGGTLETKAATDVCRSLACPSQFAQVDFDVAESCSSVM